MTEFPPHVVEMLDKYIESRFSIESSADEVESAKKRLVQAQKRYEACCCRLEEDKKSQREIIALINKELSGEVAA